MVWMRRKKLIVYRLTVAARMKQKRSTYQVCTLLFASPVCQSINKKRTMILLGFGVYIVISVGVLLMNVAALSKP